MNYSHFVGLDIGKKTFDASLMSLEEKVLAHSTFDNNSEGIKKLLEWVSSQGLSVKCTLFCAENMGNYVTDLSVASITRSYGLALVCPLTIDPTWQKYPSKRHGIGLLVEVTKFVFSR
ncbi:MAG: IS110 family transposase [Tannerella sp.]|jgi:hypothetical protein|nr:IS110 family transposase [Tannerella sp.]